jgi:mRNA-degrading endonuclease RelE of RelBE toxin-antitoxin system
VVIRRVVWTPRALRDARRLGQETAQRIGRALDRYVETGYGDVKNLIDREDQKRLRVGKTRVIFTERDDILEVVAVLPRDKAYRTREPMEAYGIVELSMAGAA